MHLQYVAAMSIMLLQHSQQEKLWNIFQNTDSWTGYTTCQYTFQYKPLRKSWR